MQRKNVIEAVHEKERLARIQVMQGQHAYQGVQAFRSLKDGSQSETYRNLELQGYYDTLQKNFPSRKNERKVLDFDVSNAKLNCYYIDEEAKDVLDLLLCIFQKEEHIKDIKLDEKTYAIDILMKDDFGDIRVGVKIFRINEKTSVIDYQKKSGDLMMYYKQIKKIKTDYLAKLDDESNKDKKEVKQE